LDLWPRGGLGRILEARDLALDRTMALKEVRPDRDAPDTRARLVREGRVNGRLEHPGIVPVFGLGCHPDGRPFYVMRLIEGENLDAAVARFHNAGPSPDPTRRPLALNDLLTHFVAVCDAIDYAHSRGVIHRDLKPANIMLGRFGETLVVDWGLAKPFGPTWRPIDLVPVEGAPAAPGGTFETTHGLAVGTPHYMSPEQASGRSDLLGPASDIYCLGATLYDVLTGRPPFGESTDSDEVMQRAVVGDFSGRDGSGPTFRGRWRRSA
jgi:serine/threonine protein kinase